MILEANTDVLTSLRDFYKRLADNNDFDLKLDCEVDILEFAIQIDDMIYDSKMQISRAKVQVKITADRKNLVRTAPPMICVFTDPELDLAAPSKSGNYEYGGAHQSYYKDRNYVAKGSNRYAYHHRCYIDISSGNLCIG